MVPRTHSLSNIDEQKEIKSATILVLPHARTAIRTLYIPRHYRDQRDTDTELDLFLSGKEFRVFIADLKCQSPKNKSNNTTEFNCSKKMSAEILTKNNLLKVSSPASYTFLVLSLAIQQINFQGFHDVLYDGNVIARTVVVLQ